MADIFVSYSRKDTELVSQIVRDLQKADFVCWMDTSDIGSGDDYPEKIANAISECPIFFICISSASIASKHVKQEVQLAFDDNKKIIVLMLENIQIPTTMQYQLARRQLTGLWESDWQAKILKSLGDPPRGLSKIDVHRPEEEKKVHRPTGKIRVPFASKYFLPLMALFLIVVIGFGYAIYQSFVSRNMLLWAFSQGTEGWQPEKHDVKPEDVATRVSWDSSAKALQGEFDFSSAIPGNLAGGVEPRATYYIDPVKKGDWSAFQTLNFEVDNTSGHDLKVTFSISIDSCWYEFGEYQPLPQNQKSSLQFDLKDAQYKTCRVPDRKDNPPAVFNAVWRFDIIFGTPEDPDQVKGSVLISNIKLTDRIPDTK